MRTSEEHPQTPIEQAIENILLLDGAILEEIQFRGGPTHSHGGSRYLRYGYWQRLSQKVIEEISEWVTEDDDFDDDCGYLFSYRFKDKK